ncbi:MAG: amino acid adenylation domain-containing protein [Solirubrobacterales bacterium]
MSSLLQDYLSEQAERRPGEAALVLGDERLTYAELEELSGRLAGLLADSGCGPGDRVCLLSSKSPSAVVAMLAVLKAGGAYVPIDTSSPAPRVGLVLRAADPRLLLVDPGAEPLLDGVIADGEVDAPVGSLGPGALEGERFRTSFGIDDAAGRDPLPAREGSDDELAHLLFTSGSTGAPKGVGITHRNVTAFIDWAVGHFGIEPGDRLSGHPPLHFDLSTFDIYGTLAAGATLHMVPAEANLLPRRLTEFVRERQLAQWFSVPSTMAYMARHGALAPDGLPSLKRVIWCGEVLPTAILIEWMRLVPQASFTNLYGPTEATIASSFHTVIEIPPDPTEPIPIGTACVGEELLVTDEGRVLGDGENGELCIGGVGLSPGYWRDEERTREVFVSDPRPEREGERIYRTGDLAVRDDAGIFHFLGRLDSQIKSRGHRIELGEIEAALGTFDELAECAVVGVNSEGFEGTAICCAYAPVDDADVAPPELRTRLAELLPSYMLPSQWEPLESLPKNVNGKIDRKRLRELFVAR